MVEPLRIAQIAPIAGPVAPDAGSSIEQLVSLLTEELVRRGHEVTLFATGDSRTPAALHAVYEQGYLSDGSLWNWELHETMNAAAAFERAAEFDVIHGHAYHYALPFARMTGTPAVHTYHILPDPDVLGLYARYPEARMVALSRYHRGKLKGVADVPVIYNGIDTGAFPFNPERGDYLFFLGHLSPGKGPVEAVRVARAAGMRLVLAGHAGEYFRAEVEPLVVTPVVCEGM